MNVNILPIKMLFLLIKPHALIPPNTKNEHMPKDSTLYTYSGWTIIRLLKIFQLILSFLTVIL